MRRGRLGGKEEEKVVERPPVVRRSRPMSRAPTLGEEEREKSKLSSVRSKIRDQIREDKRKYMQAQKEKARGGGGKAGMSKIAAIRAAARAKAKEGGKAPNPLDNYEIALPSAPPPSHNTIQHSPVPSTRSPIHISSSPAHDSPVHNSPVHNSPVHSRITTSSPSPPSPQSRSPQPSKPTDLVAWLREQQTSTSSPPQESQPQPQPPKSARRPLAFPPPPTTSSNASPHTLPPLRIAEAFLRSELASFFAPPSAHPVVSENWDFDTIISH